MKISECETNGGVSEADGALRPQDTGETAFSGDKSQPKEADEREGIKRWSTGG